MNGGGERESVLQRIESACYRGEREVRQYISRLLVLGWGYLRKLKEVAFIL